MKFYKMHGIGNDYIYFDCFKDKIFDPEKLAVRLSDRHFGIGGDGIILLCPSDKADIRMRMFNADGSEGRMCGNGIRCLSKLACILGSDVKTYDDLIDKTIAEIEVLCKKARRLRGINE